MGSSFFRSPHWSPLFLAKYSGPGGGQLNHQGSQISAPPPQIPGSSRIRYFLFLEPWKRVEGGGWGSVTHKSLKRWQYQSLLVNRITLLTKGSGKYEVTSENNARVLPLMILSLFLYSFGPFCTGNKNLVDRKIIICQSFCSNFPNSSFSSKCF